MLIPCARWNQRAETAQPFVKANTALEILSWGTYESREDGP